MTATLSAALVRDLILGKPVSRAAAVLPAGTQAAIFTVAGGRVELVRIVGECTTVCSGTATTLKITANPTTGTDVDLCTATAVTSKEVGTLVGISGVNTDGLVVLNAGAGPGELTRKVIVPVGTIDLVTSATNTGQFKWRVWYRDVDGVGASVTAA